MRGKLLTCVGAGAIAAGTVRAIHHLPQLESGRGDSALIAEVRHYLAGDRALRNRLSLAVIGSGSPRQAHFGADATTEYEIGPVTTTFTGALFAQLVNTGAVSEHTPLTRYFELDDTPAGAMTLGELATHHSGLPRQAVPQTTFTAVKQLLSTSDPARQLTVSDLVAAARRAPRGGKTFAYSNLGFALLGAALAAEYETTYPQLVQHQLARPLQLMGTYVPTGCEDLSPAARGYTLIGRRARPWTCGAKAPSLAMRSTLGDMVRYLGATIDGSAPGVGATRARAAGDHATQVGFGWMIDGPVCWHGGSTGGFSSWVGFDRELRVGVVVLSNTASPVTKLGNALLHAARHTARHT
ncbi:MAG: serine hydrolase domain-containing protein [Bowdeniella nasicola]|nr:serine hydrolase domain-containing protein [Bowdeniella nasicola]